jgi:hypothetical protein
VGKWKAGCGDGNTHLFPEVISYVRQRLRERALVKPHFHVLLVRRRRHGGAARVHRRRHPKRDPATGQDADVDFLAAVGVMHREKRRQQPEFFELHCEGASEGTEQSRTGVHA